MNILLFWVLYYPFRKICSWLPLSESLAIADMLGDIEYRVVYKNRFHPFSRFLTSIFSGTPHESRIEAIKRACFRYRHRAFVIRNWHSGRDFRLPVMNSKYLRLFDGRGICFPVFHIGYFYSGFSSLATLLDVPLYTVSVMKSRGLGMESKFLELKKKSIQGLAVRPIFDIPSLKNICLPQVSKGQACYAPTLDAVTRTSSEHSFLGNSLVLSLRATARFVKDNKIPVVPFFTIGTNIRNAKVVLARPFDPNDFGRVEAAFEQWVLSILEKIVLKYPEQVDWFFWWKNKERFRKR